MVRLSQSAAFLLLCPMWSFAAERYVAMFADGNRAEEAEVREWCEPTSQAKIGGRVLFDPNVPVRWIIDRNQSPASIPVMYVEFAGGDRLAGEVISYSDGQDNPYEIQLPHLVVKPVAEVQPPDVFLPSKVRVTTDWVQRVVWERVGPEEIRPGNVWLKSGASIPFRSLRWTATGVTLLTENGVKQIPMSDLGEVHLPKLNPWTAYFEQLAVLSPDTKSRLVQMTANDGSRWTTSLERFQSRHYADRNRPELWFQLIQPAWSLDPVWLRYRTINAWRFFAPNEMPLSNVIPVETKHQSVFGNHWNWQTDLNVQGGRLQSFDKDFGWGFGVHGSSELVFEFPEIVKSLRTQFGLDRHAGTGGCVNVEVLVGIGKSVIRQSNLIGSTAVGVVDWLEIPTGSKEQRRVTLRTEMAHQGRPAGADPFDVRDIVNWYEPEIRLDPSALEAEVAARSVTRIGGLSGWNLSAGDAKSMKVSNVVEPYDPRDPKFRRVVRSTDRFYILSRNVKVGVKDNWLAVIGSRLAENTTPTIVQVRVDGRVLGEFDVPIRNTMIDPEPMLVPVQAYQGRSAFVEIIAYPTDDKSWVDWRGHSIGPNRPGLLPLFEDDERFAALLEQVTGRVELDADKPYSGKHSIKVTPGAGANPAIPGLDAVINESPNLGQYRYVVFAWKKTTGTRIQLQFATQGRLGDVGGLFEEVPQPTIRRGLRRTQTLDERGQRYRYCYEEGVASTQPPLPLWLHGDLPREWQLIQRDIFGDFGFLSITGLSLNCVDGDAAWFDHIYLARTHEDLNYVSTLLVNPQPPPPQPDGNGMMPIARRENYPIEFSRLAPLFSSLDMAHGLTRQVEHKGQLDVLRTHPNEPNRPMILHAGLVLPKDRPMLLDLHVTNQPLCDWQLIVRANGEVLADQLIDDALTIRQRGWATVQVDLSKFAGQKVLLEVLNQSNNWSNETAFWKRIELLER